MDTNGRNIDNIPEDEDELLVIPDYDSAEEVEEDAHRQSIMAERIKASEKIEEREKYKPEKLPFKKAVVNFFYHYKLIIVAFVFFAVVAVFGFVSCINKDYDYKTVIYACDQEYTNDLLALVSYRLGQFGRDVDGNGKVNMQTLYYDYFSDDYYKSISTQTFHENDFGKDHRYLIIISDYKSYQYMLNVYDDDGNVTGQKYDFFYDFGGGLRWIPLGNDLTDKFDEYGLNSKLGMSLYNIDYYDYMKLRDDAEVVARFDTCRELIENYLAAHPEITPETAQAFFDACAAESLVSSSDVSASGNAETAVQ